MNEMSVPPTRGRFPLATGAPLGGRTRNYSSDPAGDVLSVRCVARTAAQIVRCQSLVGSGTVAEAAARASPGWLRLVSSQWFQIKQHNRSAVFKFSQFPRSIKSTIDIQKGDGVKGPAPPPPLFIHFNEFLVAMGTDSS